MDKNQEIQVIQTNHQIKFHMYDINKVVAFNRYMCSAYFLPACLERDTYKGECADKPKEDCKYCKNKSKLEELLVDGFYVDDGDYIAYLQIGIRVPVKREVYDNWRISIEREYEDLS